MQVSIKNILKHSSKFSGINLLSKFINLPVTLLIASILEPKDFGIVGYAGLWFTYATWFSFGIFEASGREIPALLKRGETNKVEELQDIAFSIEIIISLVISLILVGVSISQSDTVIRTIMLIMCLGFLITKAFNFINGLNFFYLNFSLVARGRLIFTTLYPIITIGLLFWIKIYALFLPALILNVIILFYYLARAKYNFKFVFNMQETKRLMTAGLPLLGGSLLYTAFTGLADKTIIAGYLSKQELGLYIFAANFLILFLEIFKDYARVLKPSIWSESENAKTTQEGFAPLKRMSVYFSIITAFLIGFLQLSFLVLVNYITTKFIAAGWVFILLISYIFWESIEKFPEMILTSARVNKQTIVMFIWGVCLILNIALDFWAVKSGYGIIGIAIITTFTQAFSSFLMYLFSLRYFFNSRQEGRKYLIRIFSPFVLPFMFTIMHWVLLNRINLILLILFSVLLQILLWYVFIKLLYRDYFNKKDLQYKISLVYREIRDYFLQKLSVLFN